MKKKQEISILGCGWVGKALAKKLKSTYIIKASVQSQSSLESLEVKNKNILNNENNFNSSSFYKTDILIISIPPKGEYLKNLQTIFTHIQAHTQVILLSSTSVYSQIQGVVTEKDTNEITHPSLMLKGEQLAQKLYPSLLILRLGGLMGYNRIAGKYTAGKTIDHNSPVNYVHRDDVVKVIIKCIEQNIQATILNVVAPLSSTKKEVYDYNANIYKFLKTSFKHQELKGKIVSSKKLREVLAYNFLYSKLTNICKS